MTKNIDVVKVIIKNEDENILAVREKLSEKWELPGGKIKSSENRFEAAKRELQEEIGVNSSRFKDVVRVELEDKTCVNCYIVYTEDFNGEPRIEKNGELDKMKWVKPEEYKLLDWHTDSGYSIPAVENLDEYLD